MDSDQVYRWRWYTRLNYVSKRTRALSRISFKMALTSRGSEARQQNFDRLCDFMLQAGGVYTKFLQGVLLGVPEVQSWRKRQHIDFFEHVPEENLAVGDILMNELGSRTARLRLWPETIASGTFAQVYAGLVDIDEQVVVKIQRPHIRLSLKHDVWVLKKFVRYGKPFLTSLDADLGSMSKDFARITLAEMDYAREARLGEELRAAAAKHHPDLVIPKTYLDMSDAHVIIQERIGGVSLAELLQSGKELTAQQRQQVKDVMRHVLLLPFTTGLVHADPHPGNIRLLPDGRVALLDFGAIDDRPVSQTVYQALLTAVSKATDGTITASEALNAYFAAYAPKLHRAIGITGRALGLPSVLDVCAKFALGSQAEAPQSAFKGSVLALADINKMVNPGNRFMLRTRLQNVSYARAIHTLMQTMQLFNLHEDMIACLNEIQQELPSLAVLGKGAKEEPMSVFEAKELVYNWLAKVVERNPFMAVELRRSFNALRPTNKDKEQQVSPPELDTKPNL